MPQSTAHDNPSRTHVNDCKHVSDGRKKPLDREVAPCKLPDILFWFIASDRWSLSICHVEKLVPSRVFVIMFSSVIKRVVAKSETT